MAELQKTKAEASTSLVDRLAGMAHRTEERKCITSLESRVGSQSNDELMRIKIKVGDATVIDLDDEMSICDPEMPLNLLVGLTLLKIGLASGLADMLQLES